MKTFRALALLSLSCSSWLVAGLAVVHADNPSFGAYGQNGVYPAQGGVSAGAATTPNTASSTPAADKAATTADGDAAQSEQPAAACMNVTPCYNTSSPNTKGCPKAQCLAFDKANPGYFSGVDSQCQLPAGTAMMMASTESTCDPSQINPKTQASGMFQFKPSTCTAPNLLSLGTQTKCLCDYVNKTRNQYAAKTGGQTPSAGLYYLVHQQAGCGLPLALGGNARAVDVVAACVKSMKNPMGYAMKAIGWNLPKGYDVNSITAQEFANLYLAKFNGIDSTNVCLPNPNANPNSSGYNPLTATAGSVTQQMLQQASQMSQNLTASGQPLPMALLQYILGGGDISQILTPLFNPDYLTAADGGTDDASSAKDTSAEATKVTIITNKDSSKTVKVTKGHDTSTYELSEGKALWNCKGTYTVQSADAEAQMTEAACTKVTEVVKP